MPPDNPTHFTRIGPDGIQCDEYCDGKRADNNNNCIDTAAPKSFVESTTSTGGFLPFGTLTGPNRSCVTLNTVQGNSPRGLIKK